MSELLPSPIGCCNPCTPNTTGGPPGERGLPGTNGAAGAAGVSAYTFVANDDPDPQPVMPAEGDTVTINVTTSTAFVQPNQFIYVGFWGYMKVYAVPSDSELELLNPESTVDGDYPENADPGTSLPAGTRITLSGIQGPAGTATGDVLLASNNLNDVDDVATARSNLGLGTMAVQDAATVAITGGSITGITDLAVADGGTGASNAPTARTNLGLGTIATQAASAVAITGGDIDGTAIGASVPDSGGFTTLDASGAATLASVAVSGNTSILGKAFMPPGATQSLLAATPINPNAGKVKVVGSGGPVTNAATPSITAPSADGQFLILQGTHDTNTVTVQDEGTLPASGLRLGATTRVLGAGDTLLLTWDNATNLWYEIAFSAQV